MKRIFVIPDALQNQHSFIDPVFSLGSCFSEYAAAFLMHRGINTHSNPFGTVYNPFSILQQLQHISEKTSYTEHDLSYYNGLYFLFCHATAADNSNPQKVLEQTNMQLQLAKEAFFQSKLFLLTPGTAVVYENGGFITANCHRVPQTGINRRILSHKECCTFFTDSIQLIRQKKTEADIIITISPAKHYPGEPLLDSISKARLKSALEESLEQLSPDDKAHVFYFPSYEIFRDELCDRKWYKSDGTHPNMQAISIIMKRFIQTAFTPQACSIMRNIIAIQKLLRHRPQQPTGEANWKLLEKIADSLSTFTIESSQLTAMRIETAYRFTAFFPENPQTNKKINQLIPDNRLEKEVLKKFLSFFRKECELSDLPSELWKDDRLSKVIFDGMRVFFDRTGNFGVSCHRNKESNL